MANAHARLVDATLDPARARAIEDSDAASAAATLTRTTRIEWPLYLAVGTLLGFVFVRSEVLSWYRIQEMFRFQSVHMYGVIGSAVVVAAAALWVMRRLGARTLAGTPIVVPPKAWTPWAARYWMGGLVFGLGWGLLGACPGPIFTLIGAGATVFVVPLASAVAGTFVYALVRERLPH